jgi:hypothetical protein
MDRSIARKSAEEALNENFISSDAEMISKVCAIVEATLLYLFLYTLYLMPKILKYSP